MKTLTALLLLLAMLSARAQQAGHYDDLIIRADSLFMQGQYEASLHAFEAAFATGHAIEPYHLYNAACAAALSGDADKAFAHLHRRLRVEPSWYSDNLSTDPDLQLLHPDARWAALADSIARRKQRIEAGYDKPLRRRLQLIMKTDQQARLAFLAAHNAQPHDSAAEARALAEMRRVDAVNTEQVCLILDTRGLVGRDKVGDAVGTFWTVIQHAGVETQEKYLELFREAAARGDISPDGVAMMEDRINMFRGRPQQYGSQLVEDSLGRRVLYQLLDPTCVDKWRAGAGMEPLDLYLRRMNANRQ